MNALLFLIAALAADQTVTIPAPLSIGDKLTITVQGDVPPEKPPTTPTNKAQIGVNLEFPWDSSRDMALTDLFKRARFNTGNLGADGWPTSSWSARVLSVNVKGNESPAARAATHWPKDNVDPTDPTKPAAYTFTCTGKGTVWASGAKVISQAYDAATNKTAAIIHRTDNTVDMDVGMNDVSAPVRNIKIMRPGYAGSSKMFSDEFLRGLAPFDAIRFMDWFCTNVDRAPESMTRLNRALGADGLMDWAERPSMTAPTWLDNNTVSSVLGVPPELAIQLCNESNKMGWFNVSHYASQNWRVSFIELCKTLKRPFILGYSNERWNWSAGFGQYEAIHALTQKHISNNAFPNLNNPAAGPEYQAERYALAQLYALSDLCRAAGIRDKVKMVYESQISQTSLASDTLNWALRTYPNPPSYYIDYLAGAPYYGSSASGTGTPAQIVAGVIQSANDKNLWKFKNDSEQYQNKESLYYSLATTYGLKFACYEGGLNLSGDSNFGNRIAANYDPAIKDPTLAHLANTMANSCDLFMQFTLTGAMGEHTWGLTDDIITLSNPRYAAFLEAINTDPRRYEVGIVGNGYWGVAPTTALLGPGTGLTGVYKWTEGQTAKTLTRVDKLMQFGYINYQSANPVPRKDVVDNSHKGWSAEWTGKFWPEYTGPHTFAFEGKWSSLQATLDGKPIPGVVNLTAGVLVPINIKFSSTSGEGTMRFWQTVNGRKTIVKQSQLIP